MNDWILTLGHPSLKQLLIALAMPPVVWLLIIVLGALWARRRPLAGTLLLLAGVVLEYASFTPAAAELATQWLLSPPPPLRDPQRAVQPPPAKGRTVIVVLGGGRTPGAEYHEVTLSTLGMERLRYGIWLARETGLPLAYSGGIGRGGHGGPTEGAIARRIAREEFGHPLRWVEEQSRDTRENGIYTVEMLRHENIGRIVLVTHEAHQPRSIRNFERARDAAGLSFEIVPAPVGITENDPRWILSDVLPSTAGISRFRYAWREWLGLLAGA